ncbi:hypothetical protein Tco_0701300, partial [Tanacetum coccineum]
MCMYLKNQRGYKQSYFKGMSYEDIRPIFERVWDQNQFFVLKDFEIEKEVMKRSGFDFQKTPAKRQKIREVSGSNQGQISNYKTWDVSLKNQEVTEIIRDRNQYKSIQVFERHLKRFDRDDLEKAGIWVKKNLVPTEPHIDKEKVLWVELKGRIRSAGVRVLTTGYEGLLVMDPSSMNGNLVNENVQENVRNVIVNGNRVGCLYKEFLACNPKEYDGKGGAVVLTHWVEKMESMHDMSSCSVDQKVKYIAGSFVGMPLTWWNSQIRTLSQEVAISMSWNNFKFMMIQEFCPSHEMQKLESELWNHAMVGAGHAAYTDMFHELS